VRQVFLGCENDPRALCFAGVLDGSLLGRPNDNIRRGADLGDAFAQAEMARRRISFQWAEKSAAQGERDAFYFLGRCYRDELGCEEDVEKTKENFFFAAELGHVYAMVCVGKLLDKDDPQRFVWFGGCSVFVNEMLELLQFRNWTCKSCFRNRTSFERTNRQREAHNVWERLQL
jgi:TPR repeat protein